METVTNKQIQVEYRSTTSLVPYARNARTHSDAQVDQIVESIRTFGWTNPVLIDAAGGIIAGHGRVMAAQKIGMAQVPCIELGHLSDAARRAYILADNKLALNSGWDEEMLTLEMNELADLGFNLDVIGFSDAEIEAMLAEPGTQGETDADAVPEIQATAVSQLGQVWQLGRHRLACGDCTDAAVVDRVLAGVKPHLMVTDPPYGVEYDANWRNEADRANGKAYGARAVGKVENDDRSDWREAWALFPGDVAYVWHAGRFAADVQQSLAVCNFEIRSQIIWAKPRFAISRGHYHWQHEPCWYAVRKGGGRTLGRRSLANDTVVNPAQQVGNRSQYAKADRVYVAPHPQQFEPRTGRLRAFFRQRNNDHRGGEIWARVLCDRTESAIRRHGDTPLAGIHRHSGDAGRRRSHVRGDRGGIT